MNTPAAVAAPALVGAGVFHQLTLQGAAQKWLVEIASLEGLLATGVSAGVGVFETALLHWFGHSLERIALLAYATHGIVPTHVAREMTLGTFRADFAWISIDTNAAPVVCFVELEEARPDTLFRQGTRIAPYIGRKFLDGFSQLVDWCCFGHGEAKNHPLVAAVLGNNNRTVSYNFSLIAGLDDFANNAALQHRLEWWRRNIIVGDGTTTLTFSAFCQHAKRNLNNVQHL